MKHYIKIHGIPLCWHCICFVFIARFDSGFYLVYPEEDCKPKRWVCSQITMLASVFSIYCFVMKYMIIMPVSASSSLNTSWHYGVFFLFTISLQITNGKLPLTLKAFIVFSCFKLFVLRHFKYNWLSCVRFCFTFLHLARFHDWRYPILYSIANLVPAELNGRQFPLARHCISYARHSTLRMNLL